MKRRGLPARAAAPYVRVTLSPRVEQITKSKAAPVEPQVTTASAGETASQVARAIETYIERCRARIPSFVDDNFSIRQTWTLQRPTLWRDLACAPINSVWALPYLAMNKAADTADRIGYARFTRPSKRLPRGIKTGYQREIERRICRDLLEWDRDASSSELPQGLLKELEAIPSVRTRLETLAVEYDERAPSRTLVDVLHQFSGGRAIVSDFANTLLTLGTSWFLLGSASVSLSNLAHGVARKAAHDRAASKFFLGKKAGNVFYNVFHPSVDESTIWITVVVLALCLAAGGLACTILSDPLRKLLGFHRYRLEVLLDEVERELIVLSHKRLRG